MNKFLLGLMLTAYLSPCLASRPIQVIAAAVQINGNNSVPTNQPTSVAILITGGLPPYTFQEGTNTPQASGFFNDVTPSDASVFTIKDSSGQSTQVTINTQESTAFTTSTALVTGVYGTNPSTLGSALIATDFLTANTLPVGATLVFNLFQNNKIIHSSGPITDSFYTFTGLPAGEYTATITGTGFPTGSNPNASFTFVVQQFANLAINPIFTQPADTPGFGGQAAIPVVGGSGFFSYIVQSTTDPAIQEEKLFVPFATELTSSLLLITNASNSSITNNFLNILIALTDTISARDANIFSDLKAGDYTVTVTDYGTDLPGFFNKNNTQSVAAPADPGRASVTAPFTIPATGGIKVTSVNALGQFIGTKYCKQ